MSVRALPFHAARGFSRIEAARYVGVSPSTFDKLVSAGRMPAPKRVGKRCIYDREALDLAFELLPGEDERNPWDE